MSEIGMTASLPLEALDSAPEADAAAVLRACCASDRWVAQLLAGRPYGDLARLTAVGRDAVLALPWPDVEQALAAHPRIGERAAGADREAAWSRQEQSGASAAPAGTQDALRRANVAYEERFGHVYLVCATGRTAEELLADATARLAHDPDTEHDVVRRELAAIVELRLAKALV
ncbi:2-oxo-4-hydroxy-4-carboxy-5-ureidoimidazoline decarboxylase [Blastococcus sp. LR1]|uniref:2-oxo-4-hydroxy-4-carboxy-5-ureidoimidazoline decarboxylase n=1 Tax=Blastococcus sp. LR1 TaxID=2877000 RepID=UPI001CC9872A|nr:2-oxo-4-hydroxy-4-carboxy-5-ureidoimidazoline decarboxylase [Blastococcus sp. LR1]MCA0145357.1 2-oxo-4-hydroxy-4-carboxy-5-ureidoimidazoline decarboxylase [Blastococcus sp. LR1]